MNNPFTHSRFVEVIDHDRSDTSYTYVVHADLPAIRRRARAALDALAGVEGVVSVTLYQGDDVVVFECEHYEDETDGWEDHGPDTALIGADVDAEIHVKGGKVYIMAYTPVGREEVGIIDL